MATKLIIFLVLFLCCFSIPPAVGNSETCSAEYVAEDSYRNVYYGFGALAHSKKMLDTFTTVFPTPAMGPESLVFSSSVEGPYTGISDGRILKYEGPQIGFVDFAYASPNRTKAVCDGTRDLRMGPKCGRPLGLGFNHRTSELYIADAYYGLCKVGVEGGLATQVAINAQGLPLKWTDGIDVDQTTQIVYFTDVSTKYSMMEMAELLAAGDSTGRLLSYNPKTKEVKVLMRGLKGAGGVGVSKDSSYVLVSEYMGGRIHKYFLMGPKTGESELFIKIPAPANIKRTFSGEFIVSSNLLIQEQEAMVVIPRGVRINEYGDVLETLIFGGIYNNSMINEVQEYGDAYYVGSIYVNFAAAANKM